MATDYVDAGQAVDNSSLSPIAGSAPPVTKGVTYERILNARSEPQNWLTYYGAYDGQRYSPLDQINKENVKRLAPAWVFQAARWACTRASRRTRSRPPRSSSTGSCSSRAGTAGSGPSTPGTETQLWQYRHAIPYDVSLCCGNVNRGVAVAEGMVFVVTLNAHIIALDAETGKKVWDQTYGDVRAGESATVAPADRQGHGHRRQLRRRVRQPRPLRRVQARDRRARLADATWCPKPGEPGSETWPDDGEAWQRGGANCWVTPTYDPDLNLLYYGTGNPCPDFDGGVREGDNLYTDSGVAVDVDTGEIKAHFQYTPHDLWDYDSTMEHILFDLDGQKLAAHFDKNGFLYILDRTNMQPVRVVPFVDRIDWGEVDEKGNVTPKIYPDAEGDPVHFWPGPAGAKEWTHACYNPNTELLYCPGAGRRRDGHAAAPGVQGEHPVLGRGRRGRPRGHGGLHQRLRPADRAEEVALEQRHPDVLVRADHGRRPRVRRRADG